MRMALFFALLLPCPSLAQDPTSNLQRSLELPAHRSLMEIASKSELSDFVSDGCSGGLSSSWRVVADLFPNFAEVHNEAPPWEECCVAHDLTYHNAGGAASADESFDARLAADEVLRSCVVEEGSRRRNDLAKDYDVSPDLIDRAYQAVGDSMFTAVRFGGGPCSGLPWRWGFGYPGCLPGF